MRYYNYYISYYFPMTKAVKLQDELNIGYDVEDDDLPDEIEEDSWIDGLLTSGFHAVNDDELFGEEITGYSLY